MWIIVVCTEWILSKAKPPETNQQKWESRWKGTVILHSEPLRFKYKYKTDQLQQNASNVSHGETFSAYCIPLFRRSNFGEVAIVEDKAAPEADAGNNRADDSDGQWINILKEK